MRITKALIAGLATAFLAGGTAFAVPTLNMTVLDGVNPISLACVSGLGSLDCTGSNADFSSIAVNVIGVPLVGSPNLSSTTLDVTSATAGTHVLTIDIFQTGITAAAEPITSSFTSNTLINAPGPTTMTSYYNGTTSTLGTQLSTATFPGTGSTTLTANAASSIFADAQQYAITFTAANQSANDTIQMVGTPVPEPASLAILGIALAGLGLVRRRVS